jgi:hypothetical protein
VFEIVAKLEAQYQTLEKYRQRIALRLGREDTTVHEPFDQAAAHLTSVAGAIVTAHLPLTKEFVAELRGYGDAFEQH